MKDLLALPDLVLALIAILAVVQVGLEVAAVVDIVRRPKELIAGENKVLWVLLVLFVNLVGAVVYFAVGRKAAPVDIAPQRGEVAATAPSVIDTLYGPGGDER